jgi:predicted Na+-dependent transporter
MQELKMSSNLIYDLLFTALLLFVGFYIGRFTGFKEAASIEKHYAYSMKNSLNSCIKVISK